MSQMLTRAISCLFVALNVHFERGGSSVRFGGAIDRTDDCAVSNRIHAHDPLNCGTFGQ